MFSQSAAFHSYSLPLSTNMNLTYFFKNFFYSIKLSSVHFLSLKFFVIWLIHTLSFEGVDPLDCEKLLRLVNLDWYIAFSYIALVYCILDWYIVICHVINHHHVDLSWTAFTIYLLSLLGGGASLILVTGEQGNNKFILHAAWVFY